MFVTYLYRVRAPDPGAAVVLCEQHMEHERADTYTPLYLVSFAPSVRAVLVGPDDWRKRERQARRYHEIFGDEDSVLRHARELRISFYFHLLEGNAALRTMRHKLRDEYMSFVKGPDTERTFFAATEPILRDALRPGWGPADSPADSPEASLDDYLARRAAGVAALLRHTTDATYPFTTAGADLAYSRCFELPASGAVSSGAVYSGAVYYVVMDVHR